MAGADDVVRAKDTKGRVRFKLDGMEMVKLDVIVVVDISEVITNESAVRVGQVVWVSMGCSEGGLEVFVVEMGGKDVVGWREWIDVFGFVRAGEMESVVADGFGVRPYVADLADLHENETEAEMSKMKGRSASERQIDPYLLQEDNIFGEVLDGAELTCEMRLQHSAKALHDERPIRGERSK
jgi:hypothetical protein